LSDACCERCAQFCLSLQTACDRDRGRSSKRHRENSLSAEFVIIVTMHIRFRGALSQTETYWVPLAATGCALATPAASGAPDSFCLRPGLVDDVNVSLSTAVCIIVRYGARPIDASRQGPRGPAPLTTWPGTVPGHQWAKRANQERLEFKSGSFYHRVVLTTVTSAPSWPRRDFHRNRPGLNQILPALSVGVRPSISRGLEASSGPPARCASRGGWEGW